MVGTAERGITLPSIEALKALIDDPEAWRIWWEDDINYRFKQASEGDRKNAWVPTVFETRDLGRTEELFVKYPFF